MYIALKTTWTLTKYVTTFCITNEIGIYEKCILFENIKTWTVITIHHD